MAMIGRKPKPVNLKILEEQLKYQKTIWVKRLFKSLYFTNLDKKEDAVKNLISLLAITDVFLITISFMIILLYKKEMKNEIF